MDFIANSMSGVTIMKDDSIWEFPRNINIEDVSEYVGHLKAMECDDILIFDLRNTVKIHSSFIGFLIHAKHHINKCGGKLVLHVSLTVEKILIMLNIFDYFSPEIIPVVKKSA